MRLRRFSYPRNIARLVLCGGMLFFAPSAFGAKGMVHLDYKSSTGSLPIKT